MQSVLIVFTFSEHLLEQDDHIEVNGVTFHKPFVEKPISAEDHNVYIYFPTSAGGGSQRLFRKVGCLYTVCKLQDQIHCRSYLFLKVFKGFFLKTQCRGEQLQPSHWYFI